MSVISFMASMPGSACNAHILRELTDMRTTGRFYVAVVQAVLLFGSKTWVMTPLFEKALEGFHHRSARQMAGMGPKR